MIHKRSINLGCSMISVSDLHKHYPPEQNALNGINFSMERGEFMFLAGASGAGKSTLLKMLTGADRQTKGKVEVLGNELSSMSRSELQQHRKRLGIVFQDYKLLPRRNVLENIALPLTLQGVNERSRYNRAMSLLEHIGLRERAESYPESLSGGEQQRVAVARALAHAPDLILADEPTGNLDIHMAQRVFELLSEAQQQGITVIVATHNLGIIESAGKRALVLDEGKVLSDFTPHQSGVF